MEIFWWIKSKSKSVILAQSIKNCILWQDPWYKEIMFGYLVIQSCNKIILSVGHEQDFWIITLFTSLIIIPAQLHCRLLCFSFYHKVSVAHRILSKEDAATTVSEFLIRMFNSRLFLVAIVFSCVALECKSLHKLLEISEASIITWIVL